ncbi:zinc-ribbon domain-containing protein [Reinekea thalattae]|uniref:Zinc ribbon domain-containing protein n=1 Tax=Reinekea thalattae TaxID=2593301 RepID=A0A5C8ZAJ0_9GAMM|nr:hypothetical protein FME95_09650 [Reinekea thalattae]
MPKLCPDCKKPLEHVCSCGSSSYFCNHCNQLVSRKRVIEPDDEAGSEPSFAKSTNNEQKPNRSVKS